MRIRSFTPAKKTRIEIIPMIDTMFFLLVFFIMATLSMTIQRGLPVNLPKAESARTDFKENVSVTMSRDGQIYYNKEKIELADLRGRVESEVAVNPELLVILNADEEVLHGKVVELMDEIKLAGVTKFAIATKPKKAMGSELP